MALATSLTIGFDLQQGNKKISIGDLTKQTKRDFTYYCKELIRQCQGVETEALLAHALWILGSSLGKDLLWSSYIFATFNDVLFNLAGSAQRIQEANVNIEKSVEKDWKLDSRIITNRSVVEGNRMS